MKNLLVLIHILTTSANIFANFGQKVGNYLPNKVLGDSYLMSTVHEMSNIEIIFVTEKPKEKMAVLAFEKAKRLDTTKNSKILPAVNKWIYQKFYKEWDRSDKKMIEENKKKIQTITQLIFKKIGSKYSFIMFLAHALHNTSGFKNMGEFKGNPNTEKFRCRGLLQIKGEKNYLKLGKLRGDPKYYVENPDKLGKLTENAISITIKFWDNLLNNIHGKVDFNTTYKKLVPNHFQKNPNSEALNINNSRYEYYNELRECLKKY